MDHLSALKSRIQPGADLLLGGEVYRLVFPYSAIAEAEVETEGAFTLSGGIRTDFFTQAAAWQFRAFLCAALRTHHPEGPRELAGIISGIGSHDAALALCNAWSLSLPEKIKDRRRATEQLTNAQLWEGCWSAARFHLGLTDRQFGDLTPRQLSVLLDRHREEKDLEKTLFGVVAAAAANFGYRAPEQPLMPADFVGDNRSAVRRKGDVESDRQAERRTRALLMSLVPAEQRPN